MYSLEEKYDLIRKDIVNVQSKNPVLIAKLIMGKDYIAIHGPEHHFLDGAAFLVAYANIDNGFDLTAALDELAKRTIQMPGAICGKWGVCGSVAAVGAAMSIIHGTGPLSINDYYKNQMEYTSSTLSIMSKIGGPRCCKRNAFISLSNGAKFFNTKYKISMEYNEEVCEFSNLNQQCLKGRCPYNRE